MSTSPNLLAYMQIRKCHFFYSECPTEVVLNFHHSVGSDDTIRPTNGDSGLYAVNELNHYHNAEIENQYTEIGEKGQRKEVPIMNNDSSHTEVSMQF